MQLKFRQLRAGVLAGLGAGCVNGIFGAAGGMVLIPVLQWTKALDEDMLFPMSVTVMLPICILSLSMSSPITSLPWAEALPYLIGGGLGGIGAGLWGRKIPLLWLHRIFGIIILWGGIRYLW